MISRSLGCDTLIQMLFKLLQFECVRSDHTLWARRRAQDAKEERLVQILGWC